MIGRQGAIAVGLSAAILAGCAVGPDYSRPQLAHMDVYRSDSVPAATVSTDTPGGKEQKLLAGADVPGAWWALFRSPALNELVLEALKSNPDIASARAALSVAMENVKAQQGAYFPAISAGYLASRNSNSATLSPALSSGQLLFNLYQTQLNASWTIDLWGGNRRAIEALQAQADAQRYQLESVYVALIANVVAAAVQEASLREEIAAAREIVRIEAESLEILKRQNQAGQIAGADVAAQEAALAQSEQALLPLEKQLAQQRDVLNRLAGHMPGNAVRQSFHLNSIELPQDIPISIPSRLVEQRPDVRIAEENVHAASAAVGVAIANMLPNITIVANDGSAAIQAAQLFSPGSGFWSLAGGVTQPLFDGGTLLHKSRAARANYAQAVAQYQGVVDSAFQQVADALYAVEYDARIFKAAGASEHAAAESLSITQNQLRLGAVNYVALLASQQTYEQAVITRVQAQAARLSDTAALFQAIGGGWWNRSDISDDQAEANADTSRK